MRPMIWPDLISWQGNGAHDTDVKQGAGPTGNG